MATERRLGPFDYERLVAAGIVGDLEGKKVERRRHCYAIAAVVKLSVLSLWH